MSQVVGNDQNIVLGPGQSFGVGVAYSISYDPFQVQSPDPWPGNVLVEPQPIPPSTNVFIPFNMTGVMNDGELYWFYINVQNTDPSNNGNSVTFNLQAAIYNSQVVSGTESVELGPGGSFFTGVAYGSGWPGNVLVQPQPTTEGIVIPYSMAGVMLDGEGSDWFYIVVLNSDPTQTVSFALQSSTS